MAPKKKPSGRSEAARPRGVAKRMCTMHAALTVRGGAALNKMNMPRTLPNVKEKVRRCEGVEGRVDDGIKRWEMLLRR